MMDLETSKLRVPILFGVVAMKCLHQKSIVRFLNKKNLWVSENI